MKRLTLILVLLLALCSCTSQKDNTFIMPVNEYNLFEKLNNNTRVELYKANNNEDLDNIQLINLFKEFKSFKLTDINGNEINLDNYLDKQIIIEVVATWCPYCKKQEENYNEDLTYLLDSDTIFIQYFLEGTTETIKEYYLEANKEIDDSKIIIQENEEFNDYLKNELFIDSLPCFIFIKNKQITWMHIGFTNIEYIYYSYNYAFNDYLNEEDLVDENNESIFKDYRTYLDVKNDLSEDNLNKLIALDNNNKTVKLTCKNLGIEVDYDNLYVGSYENDFDYSDYKDEDLIVFYINLDNTEEDLNKITLINELAKDKNYKYLVIINCDFDYSSSKTFVVNQYLDKLELDYLFYESNIPKTFRNITAKDYVTALFIKKGTIAGVYSNVEDASLFEEAIDLFIDNSIALVANNE